MLFGVRFARDEALKKELLADYTSWKTRQARAMQERAAEMTVSFGKLFGLTEQQINEKLNNNNPFEIKIPDFSEVISLLSENGCRHYYITGSVLEMCRKIKVQEPFDLEWLAPIPDGRRQLNFGNQFIRYQKNGARIVAHAASYDEDPQTKNKGIRYTFFNMDLEHKQISGVELGDDYNDKNILTNYLDFDTTSRRLFFQLVSFMELADVQEVLVAPGAKHGVKKAPDNLLNNERFPITVVNTSWNKIIRREGFSVDGHLRNQRWGPGLSRRRWVWIDPFHKNGYNLNARRLENKNDRGKKM